MGIFVELSVNGKRTAIHTTFSTFRKERSPLFWRKLGYAFLKTFEPAECLTGESANLNSAIISFFRQLISISLKKR